MAEEEVVIPTKEEILGTVEDSSVVVGETAPQHSEAETRAMERGWTPKDQWKGDPAQWRPADVWLDRGEFLQTIQGLRSELTATKAQVAESFKIGQRMAEAQLKKELDELKDQRRDALREGDFVAADEVDNKIDEIKERAAQAKQAPRIDPTQLATPPEYNTFVQRNPWYTEDPAFHYAADGMGYEFMRVNPKASPADLYHFVETKMREKFPELAGGKKKLSPPSPDGGNGQVPREGSGRGDSLSAVKSQMSELERGIMKNLINSGTFKNEKEYLEAYVSAPVRNR